MSIESILKKYHTWIKVVTSVLIYKMLSLFCDKNLKKVIWENNLEKFLSFFSIWIWFINWEPYKGGIQTGENTLKSRET